MQRSDQDGGVVGHEVHLLPQVLQKYIYMWNDSHRMPTECGQKTSDSWKGKKIPMKPGSTTTTKKVRKQLGWTCIPGRELWVCVCLFVCVSAWVLRNRKKCACRGLDWCVCGYMDGFVCGGRQECVCVSTLRFECGVSDGGMGVYVPHLLYPFICRWTLRLLPCPGYCKKSHVPKCSLQLYLQ